MKEYNKALICLFDCLLRFVWSGKTTNHKFEAIDHLGFDIFCEHVDILTWQQ